MGTKPRRRRQYGTGAIFQRADGRWVGRIEAGYTPTGGRRQVTVVAKTEAEAKRRLMEKQRRIAKEGIPQAGLGRVTVKAWADVWLPMHARAVRPKSYGTDAGAVRKWIVPTIGHRRLDSLTPGDVRAVSAAIRKAGRSSTTARQAHWTLMGMLKAARLDGHQVPPRVTQVPAPVRAVTDRQAIEPDQLLDIVDVINRRDDRARWVAGIHQGLRQGEALGLPWDCVDLAAGTLDVSWQLQSLPYNRPRDRSSGFRVPDGYEARRLINAWHLVRPKTASGQRIIPLVPWMTAALAQWRQVAPGNPWGLVWSLDGKPINPIDDRRTWEEIQAEAEVAHPAGRPYLGHEARHTAATLLLEAGVDPITVTAIMGHSTVLTSRGYQHVSQALARQALESVAERLGLTAG